jgi:predicted RNase H-like HicB family nuclease
MVKVWWDDENEVFIAQDTDRSGCYAVGRTKGEVLAELESARESWDKAKDSFLQILRDRPKRH